MTWTWQFLDANGCLVTVDDDDLAGQEFHNQSDAETWLGEAFSDLLEAGVESVNLLNGSALAYGPMSLHPKN